MFTGIVEEMGRVNGLSNGRLVIGATTVIADIGSGDSIAVNGCCLTVVEFGPGWWSADLSEETLGRTGFGRLRAGDVVNLERAVRAQDRLGGHLVQGHVDGVGEVVAPVPDLRIRVPGTLQRYIVEKGSIAVDGVSLTVVQPTEDGFTVAVIPHTAEVTSLGGLQPGDLVNIEVDAIAKYVEQLLPYVALPRPLPERSATTIPPGAQP